MSASLQAEKTKQKTAPKPRMPELERSLVLFAPIVTTKDGVKKIALSTERKKGRIEIFGGAINGNENHHDTLYREFIIEGKARWLKKAIKKVVPNSVNHFKLKKPNFHSEKFGKNSEYTQFTIAGVYFYHMKEDMVPAQFLFTAKEILSNDRLSEIGKEIILDMVSTGHL